MRQGCFESDRILAIRTDTANTTEAKSGEWGIDIAPENHLLPFQSRHGTPDRIFIVATVMTARCRSSASDSEGSLGDRCRMAFQGSFRT